MGEGILNSFDIFRPFLFPLLSHIYIYICKSIFLSKKSPLLKMARIGIDKAPRSSVNLSLAERMKEKERERDGRLSATAGRKGGIVEVAWHCRGRRSGRG